MKKAQLMAHPLYYVFVLIVVVLILIFGMDIIGKLKNTQEKSKFVEFKIDFENNIDNVYLKNPGTKISYELSLPIDVKEVCFNDNGEVKASSEYFQTFYVDKLRTSVNCITVKNNILKFTLENKIVDGETIVEIS